MKRVVEFLICFICVSSLQCCSISVHDPVNTEDSRLKGGKINPGSVLLVKIEAESMSLSGPYAGLINNPFNGVGLYASGDNSKVNFTFQTIPGQYRIDVKGRSSTTTPALVTVYLDSLKIGAVTLPNTTGISSITFETTTSPLTKEIRLSGELDNGSWDVQLDWIEIVYLGSIPTPPPAPIPPQTSVWASGVYRNLFKEWGKTETEVNQKVGTAVSNFFGYGAPDLQCYYTAGADKAYIFTADTSDVRSEGMSYGMMIAVQMNMKVEFDKLWNFAKTYMQHKSGDRVGYFAWQCRTDGSMLDQNPAPDGEEYFTMALYFAWKRWGNGTGIYNYKSEADSILDHMLHQDVYAGQYSGVTRMVDPSSKQVVFVPYGSSANFTDPSYHLPAFYELYAKWANKDNAYWSQIAAVSRSYWKTACNTSTGLFPDYSEFNGQPNNTGNHGDFRFDAWRVIQNIAVDYYWWRLDSWELTASEKILNFFHSKGVTSYGNQYSLSGSQLNGDHSPGLVAMNAVAALTSSQQKAWDFVKNLWDVEPTRGMYRYYDGCLYLFGLLHVSGKFKIWGTDGGMVPPASQSSVNSSFVSSRVSSVHSSIVSASSIKSSSSKISSKNSSASSAGSTGLISAYNQIEAENYSGFSSVTTIASDSGLGIQFASNTGYVYYSQIDFGPGGASSIQVRAKDTGYGLNVQFVLDSPNGPQIATVYPSGGNVWNTAINTCYPKPTGIHKVYLLVSSANAQINWFKFYP